MAINTEAHNYQHAEKTEWLTFMGCVHRATHKAQRSLWEDCKTQRWGWQKANTIRTPRKCDSMLDPHTNLNQSKFQHGREAGWIWSPPLPEELLAWGTKDVCVSVFFEDVISAMSTTSQGSSHLRVFEQCALTKENMKLGRQGGRSGSGRIWGKMDKYDQNTFCEILKNL